MEQNDRRAAPANFIEDLSVVAAQTFHGKIIGLVGTRWLESRCVMAEVAGPR
jgi:hypothetical protein